MNVDVIKRVMETELGWKRDGELFIVKEGVKATILLSTGREIVPVPRFTSVRFDHDLIVFETEEGHFFADPTSLFALRTEGDEKRLDKRPGFH